MLIISYDTGMNTGFFFIFVLILNINKDYEGYNILIPIEFYKIQRNLGISKPQGTKIKTKFDTQKLRDSVV